MNNSFLKEFTKYPSKEIADKIFKCCFLLNLFFVPLIFFWYYTKVNEKDINLNIILIAYLAIFLLLTLLSKKSINKKPSMFFIYTSSCFLFCSLSLNYISYSMIYNQFDSPLNLLIICLSVILYIILVLLVFFNINKKLKNNYTNQNKSNPKHLRAFISIFALLGILISRKIDITSSWWLLLMILSFCLIPTFTGFYKYLLLEKFE